MVDFAKRHDIINSFKYVFFVRRAPLSWKVSFYIVSYMAVGQHAKMMQQFTEEETQFCYSYNCILILCVV